MTTVIDMNAAFSFAMDACRERGALLYELKRRWEPGKADGWYAMAIKDGWFWREEDDTPEGALARLTSLLREPLGGGRASEHDFKVSERVAELDDLASLQATFDLRWKADMRAIKRWQEAHPGNDLVWPDHADMVVWLLEQLDAKEKA